MAAPPAALLPVLLLTAAAVLGGPARAHPHVWIDAVTKLHLNDDRRVVAVEQAWMFDDLYSEAMRADLDADADGRLSKAELGGYADKVLRNLAEWHFFTELTQNGRRLDFAGLDGGDALWLDKQRRFVLRFRVALETPVATADSPLVLRTFDPTYYIAIDIAKPNGVLFSDPGACAADIRPAEGAGELFLSEADFLDPDVNKGYGRLFAETARITCR